MIPAAKVHHPIAARLIERVMRAGEKRGQGDHRRRLLAGLGGRVVELGAGSGIGFRHYPNSVIEVTAVEPEAYLRRGRGGLSGERAGGRRSLRTPALRGRLF